MERSFLSAERNLHAKFLSAEKKSFNPVIGVGVSVGVGVAHPLT
jgi:hypothetical protein